MALEDFLDLLGTRNARGNIVPSRSLADLQQDIDPETGAYNSAALDTITGKPIDPNMFAYPVGGPLDALDQPSPVMPNIGNQGPRRGMQAGPFDEVDALAHVREARQGELPIIPSPTGGIGRLPDAPPPPPISSPKPSLAPAINTGGTDLRGASKPNIPQPETPDISGAFAADPASRGIGDIVMALMGQAIEGERGNRTGLPDPLGVQETPGVVPQQPVGDPANIISQPTPISGDEGDVSTGGPDIEGLFPGNEDNPIDNLINEMGLLNLTEANRIGVLQNMPDEIRQLVLARLDEIEQISSPSVGAI